MKPESHRPTGRLAAGWILAVLFFGAGCLTLGDYGTTWDEGISYRLGRQNVSLVTRVAAGGPGQAEPWPPQRVPGYQFVFDTARALFADAANALLFEPGSNLGFQLFNLLLASASLGLTYRIAWEITREQRLAVLALLCLALLPKFLAHSQSNPKDGIGLFCTALCVWLAVRAAPRPVGHSAWAGLGLGLGLANHVIAFAAAPVAAVWLLAAGEGGARRRLQRLALLVAVALVATLLFQPWLLQSPASRVPEWIASLASFPAPATSVLYLGRLFPGADPPWHYTLVMLAVSLPLVLLVAALVGSFVAREPTRRGALARLALVWLGVLLGADLFAPSRYDGVRHVLAVLPALALLSASGIVQLWQWMRAASRSVDLALGGALLAGVLSLAFDTARMHPYHDAYLSEWVRPLAGDAPERLFELEIGGGAYREGAAWLAVHADPEAIAVVPIAPHCARPHLDLEVVRRLPADSGNRPVYLMFITRVAKYKPVIREERGEPIFRIRRGRATLLEIHRLDAPGDSGAPE